MSDCCVAVWRAAVLWQALASLIPLPSSPHPCRYQKAAGEKPVVALPPEHQAAVDTATAGRPVGRGRLEVLRPILQRMATGKQLPAGVSAVADTHWYDATLYGSIFPGFPKSRIKVGRGKPESVDHLASLYDAALQLALFLAGLCGSVGGWAGWAGWRGSPGWRDTTGAALTPCPLPPPPTRCRHRYKKSFKVNDPSVQYLDAEGRLRQQYGADYKRGLAAVAAAFDASPLVQQNWLPAAAAMGNGEALAAALAAASRA